MKVIERAMTQLAAKTPVWLDGNREAVTLEKPYLKGKPKDEQWRVVLDICPSPVYLGRVSVRTIDERGA